jgi:hypothetical protein
VKSCAWCGQPMDDTKRRRKDAVTCSNRCRKALSREMKHRRSSSYTDAGSVTAPGVPYVEPPRPGALAADRASERFHRQLSRHVEASQPLNAEERAIRDHMRRNPGVLHPVLAARHVEAERERREREAAEYASHPPVKVEDPFDPTSQGSLARRAIQSRAINKPQDPYERMLRPGQSGPHPLDDLPECIDAPWSRGRR